LIIRFHYDCLCDRGSWYPFGGRQLLSGKGGWVDMVLLRNMLQIQIILD
jgi:hypothetical protein